MRRLALHYSLPLLFLLLQPPSSLSSPTVRDGWGGEGEVEGLLPGEVEGYREALITLMNLLDDGPIAQIANNPASAENGGSGGIAGENSDAEVLDGSNVAEDTSDRLVATETGNRLIGSSDIGGVEESTVVIVVEDENHDPNDLTLASILYEENAEWGPCTRSCRTRRARACMEESLCGTEPKIEEAFCYAPGSRCQTTVLQQLESEGYTIIEANEEEEEEEEDAENLGEDYWYIPDSTELQVAEDEEYDYGWDDYQAGNTIDEEEAVSEDDWLVPDSVFEEEYYNTIESNEEEEQVNQVHHNEEEEQEEQEKQEEQEEAEEEGVWECGKKGAKRSRHKIIGGKEARRGEWPWQVAILNRFKETFCGGTLISPRWVLTAAHCVKSRLYVRLAEHDLRAYDPNQMEMRVEESVPHPGYDTDTIVNDIALLKLPRAVSFSRLVTSACLPTNENDTIPADIKCVVAGWGKERESHIFGSDVLNYARVPVVPRRVCRRAYPHHPITHRQLCAGYRRGNADACAGDSGGPLVCEIRGEQRWVVHGVTSYGEGCGERGKYGVYSKVASYLPWIDSVVGG